MSELGQLKDMSASLAAELAADIHPQNEIFDRYGLTAEEGERLLANPIFDDMVDQARKDWHSIKNVKSRVKLKARIAIEEALPTLYKLISDANEPGSARVSAFKELKDIADVVEKTEQGGAEGNRLPSVTIVFGQQTDEPKEMNVQGSKGQPLAPRTMPGLDILDAEVVDDEGEEFEEIKFG